MNRKIFAYCGALAPVLYSVFLTIFSLLTPHYSNFKNAVSELGTVGAPYALPWNMLGFVLVGLLVIVFAWALYLDLIPSQGTIGVPILVGLSGVGWAGAGLFPAEAGFAPSLHTTLHFTMVAINFLPFILVAFLFAIRLKANDTWKKWIPFSVAMGIIGILSFFIPKSIPVGLSQRLGLGSYFMWLLGMSLALLGKQQKFQLGKLSQLPRVLGQY